MTNEALSTICDVSGVALAVGFVIIIASVLAYAKSLASARWFWAALCGIGVMLIAGVTFSLTNGARSTQATVHHDSDQACEAMERRGDTWICTRLVREP